MCIYIHRVLMFSLCFSLLLSISVLDVKAQKLPSTPKVSPTTIASPASSPEQDSVVLQDRVGKLEERIEQLSKDDALTTRVDTLINLLSLFSTVILGIGAFLIWNGFEMRKEARKNLAEIERLTTASFEMYANNKAVFDKYQEAMDKTMENADKSIQLLAQLVTQASQDTRAIKELKVETESIIVNWQQVKTAYSNASRGTATYFETPPPPPSVKLDELIKRAMELRAKKG